MSYRKEHQFSLSKAGYTDGLGLDLDKITEKELRELWLETVQSGMHGLCFSIYEDGQSPGDIISKEQVKRRMQIIRPYTQWVRSFSCIEGNEHVPVVAKELGMKTLVGAWLGSDMELNAKEVEGLIKLAKEGYVDIAAVGNEVMYRGDLTEEQLLEYIHTVKEALPDVTVGYVDAYYEFSHRPNITNACDVILSNCYPYWEGCPIEYSLNHMQQMYGQASDAGQGKKVIITETGWPSQGEGLKGAHPSAVNAMKYFIDTQVWSQKNNIE